MGSIRSLIFDKENFLLKVLDQLLLPFEEKYVTIVNLTDGYNVIQKMQVRGAPLIAIVGVLSLIVHLSSEEHAYSENLYDFQEELKQNLDYLRSSRPTAVNLSNACNDILSIVSHSIEMHAEDRNTILKSSELVKKINDYAIGLLDNDVKINHSMGDLGAEYILNYLKQVENFSGPFSVITICNTGSLATAGYGTALGVIRSLWKKSQQSSSEEEPQLTHVYPLETRPYNQGCRLTAFELCYEKIPSTLITDSMISSLLEKLRTQKEQETNLSPVKVALVGADRIATNGDTANKIGTLQLAKLCKLENDKILFLVVAPTSTIDMECLNGKNIIVEERPANELRQVKGGLKTKDGYEVVNIETAPSNINVWNPSFDITDCELIDGIITEKKVFVKGDHNLFHFK